MTHDTRSSYAANIGLAPQAVPAWQRAAPKRHAPYGVMEIASRHPCLFVRLAATLKRLAK